VETATTDGLTVDVAVVFSPSLEKPSRLDRRSGHRSYTIVWCTSGSKFSVSYFSISQLPTTQLHHHSTSPSLRLEHCSSLHCTPRAAPPRHLPHSWCIVLLAICVNHCTPRAAPPPDPNARVCFRTSLMDICRIIFLFRHYNKIY
jgi:hypothetical protein